MFQIRTILPLSSLKKRTDEFISLLQTTEQALLLTKHGRGAFVVMNIEYYTNLAGMAQLAGQQFEAEVSGSRS